MLDDTMLTVETNKAAVDSVSTISSSSSRSVVLYMLGPPTSTCTTATRNCSGADEITLVGHDDFGFFDDMMPSADYNNDYLFVTHDAPSIHAPLPHTNTAQSAPPPRDRLIVADTTAITVITTTATVASTSITHEHRAPHSTGP